MGEAKSPHAPTLRPGARVKGRTAPTLDRGRAGASKAPHAERRGRGRECGRARVTGAQHMFEVSVKRPEERRFRFQWRSSRSKMLRPLRSAHSGTTPRECKHPKSRQKAAKRGRNTRPKSTFGGKSLEKKIINVSSHPKKGNKTSNQNGRWIFWFELDARRSRVRPLMA